MEEVDSRNDDIPPSLYPILHYILIHPVGGDERYVVREYVLSPVRV